MEKLIKELPYLNLPTTMWGIHIHPNYEFLAIVHVSITNLKLVIDKAVLVTEENYSLTTKIFLNGLMVHIPNITVNVTRLSELSDLVYLLHGRGFCKNVSDTECLKLVEVEDNVPYCQGCYDKTMLTELTPIVVEPQEYDVTVPNYDQADVGPNESSDNKNTDKQTLCDFCGKLFSSNYRIEEHILTHTHEKPFQCKICDKLFSRGFNLRVHERTHSGAKPYICSVCGKSYTTSSNLRAHALSSHDNEKKYECRICKMCFVYPRYLKLHMRKHTGERPYVCAVCGKKFSKNVHLTMHTRVHTGEKPHCCGVCGKGFTTTGGLGYHKRTHHKD